MTRLAVAVPAKINLHLEVLGRRRDGFHELRTLYQSIDLFDRLVAETAPSGEFSLVVEPVGAVTADDDNLIIRAARRLADEMGSSAGARLNLIKRIPVGGGLGGGSANAAAALVLLDRLWGCGCEMDRLQQLAAEIGSDVPFFLWGGLALGIGRGDEVFPLPDLDPFAVVLAVPEVRVSTAEAYDRLRMRLTSNLQKGTVYAFAAGLRGNLDWRTMTNEFEEIVVDGWPAVGEVLRQLRSSAPLHASLSGSGSASYAIYTDAESAHRAATGLPAEWFVHVGSTLPRSSARLEVDEMSDDGGW